MQPREKILAGLLAAVAVVWVFGSAFKSAFIEPLQRRNNDIRDLTTDVASLELKHHELLEAARLHEEWRINSLPPESQASQREYQNWLYAMAHVAGWEDPEIGQVIRKEQSSFATVSTTLEGRTTLDGVNQFLALMESAGLVQRVSTLSIDSTDFEGNPRMNVSITLEGVAMKDATDRARLFPTALLVEECSRRDDVVHVDSVAGFPQALPFRVRIGEELLDVVSVEGSEWQVERGVAGTFSGTHETNDVVELLPLREGDPDAADLALIVDRIFVLPREPEFAGRRQLAELPPAIRGRSYSAQLDVENWSSQDGTPRFELLSGAPQGLVFEPESGLIDWQPPEDAELKTYDLEVAVYSHESDELVLAEVLSLDVRRPNRAPRLEAPGTIDVWLGRSLIFVPQVEDPDLPEDELTFSLSGDVPDDARFDRRTGEIRWTPSINERLGVLELELSVTDSGVPPAEDSVELVLNLHDDSASYTFLVGTIVQGDDHQALLYDRSTNERTWLKEGADFVIADVQGTVQSIRLTSIDVRSGGALYEWPVGDTLRAWRLIEPAGTDETSGAAGALGSLDAP